MHFITNLVFVFGGFFIEKVVYLKVQTNTYFVFCVVNLCV